MRHGACLKDGSCVPEISEDCVTQCVLRPFFKVHWFAGFAATVASVPDVLRDQFRKVPLFDKLLARIVSRTEESSMMFQSLRVSALLVWGALSAVLSMSVSFVPAGETEDTKSGNEFQTLFDGKTLEGWDGDSAVFRVEEQAIIGGQLKDKIPHNFFLASKEEYADFELQLEFRLLGKDTNAGVQLRSKRIPDHHEMIGYQADLGENYWGALYDESRRNKVLVSPDKEKLCESSEAC